MESLDPNINARLVEVLAYVAVGAIGIIGTMFTWFLLRSVNQLDRIERAQRDDTKTINDKFDAMEKLVTSEMHKMDLRVAKLEEWRKVSDLVGGKI